MQGPTRRLAFGAQLELALDDSRARVPWEGRSPRALTKGSKVVILRTRAAKSCLGPGQIELFGAGLSTEEAPWIYQGAPLLSGEV